MAAAGAEEGAWQELAERLLHHPMPGAPGVRADVVMGALPPGWPSDLPLPRDARLLGSLAHSFADFRSGYMEAVFDADGTPLHVLSAYRGDLERDGWSVFETPRPPRFAFSSGENSDGKRQSFLRSDDGPQLTVTVVSRTGSPCDVRLRLEAEVRRPPPQNRDFYAGVTERVPTLQAPSGVLVSSRQGGGGGEREWTMHGSARTDMAAGDLETHFASQLSEAGWTRLGRGDDGVVAWSSWRLPGEQEWKGMLLVHAALFEDERGLLLRVEAQRGIGATFFSAGTSTS